MFLNGTGDIRHALKTITDNCHDFGSIEVLEVRMLLSKVHTKFWIYERDIETTARSILLSEVANNSTISYKERMELFFDFYWNNFIRQQSALYLD